MREENKIRMKGKMWRTRESKNTRNILENSEEKLHHQSKGKTEEAGRTVRGDKRGQWGLKCSTVHRP